MQISKEPSWKFQYMKLLTIKILEPTFEFWHTQIFSSNQILMKIKYNQVVEERDLYLVILTVYKANRYFVRNMKIWW